MREYWSFGFKHKAETQTMPTAKGSEHFLTVLQLQASVPVHHTSANSDLAFHRHRSMTTFLCFVLTSSTVGTLLPAACRAPHRAESVLHAWLSRTCSSIWFKCFTMSRDKPSSERINTSITCKAHVVRNAPWFPSWEGVKNGRLLYGRP